jgi:hypothetical protein
MKTCRSNHARAPAALAALGAAALLWAGAVRAETGDKAIDHWRFQTSLLTHHFSPDPEHHERQELINIEAWRDDRWHLGAAVFQNSFDQPTQFLYVGYAWPVGGSENVYWRLMGGLMHGYKDEYQDKIPFNGLGIAPAIIPSFGVRYRSLFTEIQLGGTAVAMWTAGVRF